MDEKLTRATEVVVMLEKILEENSKSKTFLQSTVNHICNDHRNRKTLEDVIEKRLALARREVELLEELHSLL